MELIHQINTKQTKTKNQEHSMLVNQYSKREWVVKDFQLCLLITKATEPFQKTTKKMLISKKMNKNTKKQLSVKSF